MTQNSSQSPQGSLCFPGVGTMPALAGLLSRLERMPKVAGVIPGQGARGRPPISVSLSC